MQRDHRHALTDGAQPLRLVGGPVDDCDHQGLFPGCEVEVLHAQDGWLPAKPSQRLQQRVQGVVGGWLANHSDVHASVSEIRRLGRAGALVDLPAQARAEYPAIPAIHSRIQAGLT